MKICNILGVDVSKDYLDICVLKDGKVAYQLKIKNNLKEISKTVRWLQKEGIDFKMSLFCMEHTGIYNNILLNFLCKHGYNAWVESARQIIMSGGMVRGKSDKVDAVRIAYYAARNLERAKLWKPKRDNVVKLDALLKNRKRMIKVKNQLSVAVKESKKFISKEIAALNKRITTNPLKSILKTIEIIELEIDALIKTDEILYKQSQLSKSVPGVGQIIAAMAIVKTNEFTDYKDPRKFACQAGIAPFDHSSGTSIRGRSKVSPMADKSIKTLLHLAAMSAIKQKGELKDYYTRKVEQGKNKMCVLNAIRNKIIRRIFAAVQSGIPYRDLTFSSLTLP